MLVMKLIYFRNYTFSEFMNEYIYFTKKYIVFKTIEYTELNINVCMYSAFRTKTNNHTNNKYNQVSTVK